MKLFSHFTLCLLMEDGGWQQFFISPFKEASMWKHRRFMHADKKEIRKGGGGQRRK